MTDPTATQEWTKIAANLRRPFTTHAVQFRILEGKAIPSRKDHKANVAAYITARTAVDRLNLVCPGLWADAFVPVEGGLRCDLTVAGLTRSDVGWSNGTKTAMALKALYSDAFKRAAVKFGVGVSLYSLPGMELYLSDGDIRIWERGGGPQGAAKVSYYLQPKGATVLRARYEKWLEEHGQHFGEILDHGHVEGSADLEEGDIIAEPDAAVAAIVLPAEAIPVLERAKALGHAQLSNPETIQMMTAGRAANIVKSWAKEQMAELDKLEASRDA